MSTSAELEQMREMGQIIKEISLGNGLVVRFYDNTVRYYGDYYCVKLETVCDVPLLPDYFENERLHAEAREVVGGEVTYRRITEKMGVPSTEIERVLAHLIAQFESNSLPYFSAEKFPRKFVLSEVGKMMKKLGRHRAA